MRDGDIVAAAQEERFTRKKHDHEFPKNAVDYCLSEAGIEPDALDIVAFYDKPLLKFDRILETYLAYVPRGYKMFLKGLPLWLKQKLHTPRELDKGLDHGYSGRYVFTQHHESHAASAFFPSPFERAAILTLDGVGEWATGSIGVGEGNHIRLLKELRFPHSLGLLYSAFTYFCGFRVNSGEYKLMGLVPYGEPRYADLTREKLIDLKSDGSLRMDMSYFGFCYRDVMTSEKMDRLFGGPPPPNGRPPHPKRNGHCGIDSARDRRDHASGRDVHARADRREQAGHGRWRRAQLCLNGRILREGPFEDIWIQPAAGDAGGALGAALFVWHQLMDNPRQPLTESDHQKGSLLGPSYADDAVRTFLDSVGAEYHHYDSESDIARVIAELIDTENVVGHMDGRMEFGPRALGSRSIIGDARSPKMQSVMNLKIKFRESFRPFAPSVLRDDVDEFFEMRPREDSPYMLLVAPVRADKRCDVRDNGATGLEKLKQLRSTIPAITHVDYSARVQTVDATRHPRFHRILQSMKERTGCPVVINTSFNVRGEPIVCTPEDAYRCFMATNMDALVIGQFLLKKDEQPKAERYEIDEYLAQFQLD